MGYIQEQNNQNYSRIHNPCHECEERLVLCNPNPGRKQLPIKILYSVSLLFKIDGEIKMFQDKQNLKKFLNTKPALEKIKK